MAVTPTQLDFVAEVETSTVGDTLGNPGGGSGKMFLNQNGTWYTRSPLGVVTAMVPPAYTNENAQDAVATALTNTTSIAWTYNDAGNQITADVITEAIQDIVGAFVSAGDGTITVTYNDAGNAETIVVGSITSAKVSDFVEATQDVIGALLTDSSTIDYTYNDAGNLESIAVITTGLTGATTSAAGIMSVADKKKLNAGWTDLVNELGADATGNTDATSIITAWLAATTSGTLFLPPNCRVRVDGPVAWNKECNFIGGERRTSILSSGHATNNMFNVSSDGVLFEGLRFSAGAAGADNAALRTAGYAVNMDSTSDSSGVRKCDILFQWAGVHSSGSLQFMEDLNIREYGNNAANGNCILIDGVGDRYIRRVTTDNGSNPTGFAGVRVQTCASLVMSDCNIIHAGNALELSPGAGQTVPSVELVNCFLDTSVNGLAVVPTSTGVVARCKFTNCWFGTHTTNGILLTNPGGATSSYEGLQFVNCDIYGCPTGINASAGGGKWEFQGAIAGCTTQAVLLGPSAAHFPKISDSVIGPHGLFGANALGIVVTAGTYKGLVINDNSVVNNTGAALTLGAVTVAAGEAGFYRITDNAGINPKGSVTTPAFPAASTTVTNTTGFRVTAYVKWAATAPTAVTINGVASQLPPAAINVMPIALDPGGTFAFTGTAASGWTWIAN